MKEDFLTVEVFNSETNVTVTGVPFMDTSTNSTAATNETDVGEEDEETSELLRALGKTSRRRLRKSLNAPEKEEEAPLQDIEDGIGEESQRNFSWTIEAMTSKSMKIKMQFENPERISSETTNSVVLSFKKVERLLVSAKTRYSTPNGFSAQMKLPAQLPDTLATRSLNGASTVIAKSLSVVSVGNVAVNVAAKASLQ